MIISLHNRPIISRTALLCLLLLSFASTTASALTRVVVTSTSQCPADTVINPCYTSVADAVAAAAANGDSIEIRPGTYPVSDVVLNKSVSLYGLEAAKTFLTGNSASTVLTVDNVTVSMSIRKLTFANATTGIVIRNSSSIDIANNIFELGGGSTAIRVAGTSAPTIINNTFYANGIGISTDVLTLNIISNLFYQSTGSTAITPSGVNLASIKYNLFYLGTIGPPVLTATTVPVLPTDPIFSDPAWQGNISTLDPLFVTTTSADITQRDFHLLSGTPCQDTGNSPDLDSVDGTRADIGAYGGPNSDTIPLTVAILSSSATASDSISLSWAANPAYTVKGYKVYYGYASGNYNGNDAVVSGATATSPIDAGTATSLILSGLTSTSVTPAAPVLGAPRPLTGQLVLSWTAVPGATSYKVYYGIASTAENTVDAGSATTATLAGLTNGQTYRIAVSAVSQAAYYLAVTAYDANTGGRTVGVAHESAYSSEKSVAVGAASESSLSNEVAGMPEPINAFPNLPNTGCFIATAAYGSPENDAVVVLRAFRDRYLETNAVGRAFVRWYYAASPAAAGFLNDHPSLKPLVRGLLSPAVALAFLLTRTSTAAQAAGLLILAFLAAAWLRGRRRKHTPLTGDHGMTMKSKLVLIFLVLTLPVSVCAAEPPGDRPHWSIEIKGGWFYPDIDDWETYYGRDNTWHYTGSLAYKLTRQIELGIDGGFIKDQGQGSGAISGTVTGRVDYELFPLQAFLLFRGVFTENQWLVPYAGGGWTRIYYREKTEGQGIARGSADGYHGRAGLQFLLDDADTTASRNLRSDFGIDHTSFFLEALYSRAMINSLSGSSVNLGGTSYLMGLLFEF